VLEGLHKEKVLMFLGRAKLVKEKYNTLLYVKIRFMDTLVPILTPERGVVDGTSLRLTHRGCSEQNQDVKTGRNVMLMDIALFSSQSPDFEVGLRTLLRFLHTSIISF
jgi:hypothetical protein